MSPGRKRKSSTAAGRKSAPRTSAQKPGAKKTAAGKKSAAKSGAKKTGAGKKSAARPAAKKSAAGRKSAAKPVVRKPIARKATNKRPAAKPPHSAPYETGKWAAAFTPRKPGEVRYWLVKSEPETFSFDDLLRAKGRTTFWDGVRNSAARNFLRDGMKRGDQVFYYHSSTDPQVIVGVGEVVREGYPDHTAFDRSHHGYDERSDPAMPTWFMVDIRAVAPLARPVTLAELKTRPELADMALLRIGRLSVTPVTAAEWTVIVAMAGGLN